MIKQEKGNIKDVDVSQIKGKNSLIFLWESPENN